jgi:2-hydroxy-6-oxonona-2,4-dienedioate hydrolase
MTARTQLRGRWLQVGEHRMYLRTGSPPHPMRPPAVLVPGLSMSGRYLAPTAVALATDRHVVAPDQPGAGRSPHASSPLTVVELADAVYDLLVATTGPAVVVANSFGCQVAVELALRHPAAVRRLVLTSPVVAPRTRALASVVVRFLAAICREPWRYLGIALLDLFRGWPRKGRANLRALLAYPIEARARALTVPVLVVRGTRDPLVPAPFGRRLAQSIRLGRYVELDTTHALTFDGPDLLAGLVRSGDAPCMTRDPEGEPCQDLPRRAAASLPVRCWPARG